VREAAVTKAQNNEAVSSAIRGATAQVAAGTAWLWARPEMAILLMFSSWTRQVKISLANTLAVSQAATSVVLLGDPQQLDQLSGVFHPPGRWRFASPQGTA